MRINSTCDLLRWPIELNRCLVTDITKRKRNQELFGESEKKRPKKILIHPQNAFPQITLDYHICNEK